MSWNERLEGIYWNLVGISDRWGFPPLLSGIEPNYNRIIGEIDTYLDSYNLQTDFKIFILEKLRSYFVGCSKTHWRELRSDWYLDHEDQINKNKKIIELSSSKMVEFLDEFILELEEELKENNFSSVSNVENEINENILENEVINVKVPHKVVLLYELGIYQILKDRIMKNSSNIKDLAKIISYVIGEGNVNYIYSFLSNPELDPINSNYTNPAKDSPFTGPSVKKMKSILNDCSIEIEREYPEKPSSKNIKHNKK